MQRSVDYHSAKLIQEKAGTEDALELEDIIYQNSLMDKEDIAFLDTVGRAKQAAIEIETAIANDVVNSLNKQRQTFAEMSREAKKSGKLKEEVEVIDTDYMDETGAYKKGTKLNKAKGGEVEIPNAAPEPDERIDKMTGLPYSFQAGPAFMDEEDPLKRLGLVGGGRIVTDPMQRLGFTKRTTL